MRYRDYIDYDRDDDCGYGHSYSDDDDDSSCDCARTWFPFHMAAWNLLQSREMVTRVMPGQLFSFMTRKNIFKVSSRDTESRCCDEEPRGC